jgi:hypothetical protein
LYHKTEAKPSPDLNIVHDFAIIDLYGVMKGMTLKTRHTSVLFLGLVVILLAVAFIPSSASAFEMSITDGANAARGADQVADLFGSTGILTTVTNVMLFVVGAISVIMVIIGGFRYVISGGNSSNITTAKNTILYAVVGLIIAIMAYALVNFVIGSFVSGGAGTNV